MVYILETISVWDEFRSGGLKSLARICFSSIACMKSSGFARILPDFFVRKWLFEKILGGGGGAAAPLSPMGRMPTCMLETICKDLYCDNYLFNLHRLCMYTNTVYVYMYFPLSSAVDLKMFWTCIIEMSCMFIKVNLLCVCVCVYVHVCRHVQVNMVILHAFKSFLISHVWKYHHMFGIKWKEI